MDGDGVLRAAGECRAFLDAATGEDWTRPAPDMELTVAEVSPTSPRGCGGTRPTWRPAPAS